MNQSEKNIFVFDKNKCVGCGACAVACMNENGYQDSERWRNIYASNPGHLAQSPLFYLSLACNHCDDAPCLVNCPANALYQDKVSGAVLHDENKCIGCKYCTWACPYDAPKYNPLSGVIEKCTFCNQWIENNEDPACARHCPVGALQFSQEEFTRRQSIESSPVAVDVGAHLKCIPLRNESAPEIDMSLFEQVEYHPQPIGKNKITALSEWPLLIFTLIVPFIAGISTSTSFIMIHPQINSIVLFFGVVAAILSLFHLGKKSKTWRALLNIKKSWLSREILMFMIFMAMIFTNGFITSVGPYLFGLAGMLLLISIDRLYVLAMWNWSVKIHSAQTLFIGTSFFLILMNEPWWFLVLSLFRLVLYVFRKFEMRSELNLWVSGRLLLLLIVVIALFPEFNLPSVILVFFSGEIMDRIDFYNELRTPHPATEMGSGKEYIRNL